MHRAALIGALGLLALVSLWALWGRPPEPSSPAPLPEVRDRASRITTRPLEARRAGSGADISTTSDFPDEAALQSRGASGREARRSQLRPRDFAGDEVAVQRGAAERNFPRPAGTGAATQEALASLQSPEQPLDAEALSPDEVVARDLGAVASFSLAQGKNADRGLAPAAEEDVTYDELGAFFGPLARFIVVPPPELPSLSGTVSFWVLPAWIGESDTNAAYFQWRTNEFANRIQIFKNGPFLRFLIATEEGIESGVGVNVMHWKPGEWHAVTATWGDGVASLYIDGALAGAREYVGEIVIPPGTPWYVGSDHPEGAPGARSRVRGFQIYPRALSPEEILQVVGATQPPA